MSLPDELITQLVKATNDTAPKKNETIVYGTIVNEGGRQYVKLDGSDVLTPAVSTVEINPEERVVVSIKNHTATIMGNTSNPSASVKRMGDAESRIEQTAEEIRLEVSNLALGLESQINQNATSITTLVTNQNEFTEFQQTVEGFLFTDENGTVKIDNGSIDLTGAITWDDLNSSVRGSISGAASDASSAYSMASSANDILADWTVPDTTYIDGAKIYTGTILVDNIRLFDEMTIYKEKNSTEIGGFIGYCSGFNEASKAIGFKSLDHKSQCLCADNGARLSWGLPDSEGYGVSQFYAGDTGVIIGGKESVTFRIGITDNMWLNSTMLGPYTSGGLNLGVASRPWNTVYATTCNGTTSDRNKKNSIEDLPEKYLILFDNLQPKRFKMNDGTSGRYHVGYIAQEVEDAMNVAGVDSQEFGGLVKDVDEEGNDIYLLRYGEFDAIRDAKIKQLEAKNLELEARIEALEKLLTQ